MIGGGIVTLVVGGIVVLMWISWEMTRDPYE